MSAAQLSAVWDALPDEANHVPPAIVLVVPQDMKAACNAQHIGNSSKTKVDDNPSKWPQYVMGLGEAMLWGINNVGWPMIEGEKRVISQ